MKAEGTAWVSGAGRGIGRAVAIELARRGFDVVAGVRRPDAASDLPEAARGASGSLRVAPLDVTRPETFDVPEGLRVLVNNAGVDLAYLPVEHAPLALWREMFETNVFGLVALTRAAIPALRRSGSGVVCNVTSSSLFTPVPFYAAYRASKAAVSALGESLRVELAPFGIRVVEVAPGPIDTGMLQGSDRLPEAAAYPGYGPLSHWLLRGRRGIAHMTTAPAHAARAIVDAMLDDDAPHRNACDPLGQSQLDAWRRIGDEASLQGILSATREAPPESE